MSKFLVAGVTQIETIVRVEKIPVSFSPLTSEIDTIFTAMGGDAYNESLALEWLGDSVTFMSIVGRNQDLGLVNPPDRKITLSTEYIIPQMKATPTAVVLYDKNRKQQIFEDIKDLRENVYDMSMVAPIAQACDMMVLANANFCRPFAKAAKEYGKQIAVNIRSYNPEKEKYNFDNELIEPQRISLNQQKDCILVMILLQRIHTISLTECLQPMEQRSLFSVRAARVLFFLIRQRISVLIIKP